MKKYFILILFSTSLFAQKEIFSNAELTKKFSLIQVDQLNVSDLQACREKKCEAVAILSKPEFLKFKLSWKQNGENPTSILCKSMQAIPEIGFLSNRDEISLCRFKDGSIVLGWDLFHQWQIKDQPAR